MRGQDDFFVHTLSQYSPLLGLPLMRVDCLLRLDGTLQLAKSRLSHQRRELVADLASSSSGLRHPPRMVVADITTVRKAASHEGEAERVENEPQRLHMASKYARALQPALERCSCDPKQSMSSRNRCLGSVAAWAPNILLIWHLKIGRPLMNRLVIDLQKECMGQTVL